MKKYLLGIFAIVLAIGFSAFTVTDRNTTNQDDPVYSWHQYDVTGTIELSPVVEFPGTETEARTKFKCPSGTPLICARAYDMNGNPLSLFIRKNSQ